MMPEPPPLRAGSPRPGLLRVLVLVGLAAAYLAGYLAIRISHRQVWRKDPGDPGAVVLVFRNDAAADRWLLALYRPLLALDRRVMGVAVHRHAQ